MISSEGTFGSARVALNAVGRMAEVQLGKMLQTTSSSPEDVEVPYLRAGHLSQVPDELPTMWASPKERVQYRVEAGDILVAEGGDVGRVGFVPQSASGALIQNSLHRIRPRGGRDRRFLAYALEAVYLGDWLEVLCNKSTFGHLTVEKLKALRVPDPQPVEQQAIADYLDAETTRIDAVFNKKQRLIALLKERRHRVINSTIADGIATRTGEVGDRRFTRVKYLAGINQRSLPENAELDREIKYLDISGVGRGVLVTEPEAMNLSTAPSRARRLVQVGDTIVSTVRTYLRAVLFINDPDPALVVSTGFAVITPRKGLDARYLAWVAQSDTFVEAVVARSVGVSYPAINAGEIGDIQIPVVELDQQQAIADYLDAETARIDAATVTLERQLTLHREQRQSLITAAVTGEIEAPGVAA